MHNGTVRDNFLKGIAFLMFQNVVVCILVLYLPCGLYWVSHITLLLPYEQYCVCSVVCVMALYLLNYSTDISCPVAPGVQLQYNFCSVIWLYVSSVFIH